MFDKENIMMIEFEDSYGWDKPIPMVALFNQTNTTEEEAIQAIEAHRIQTYKSVIIMYKSQYESVFLKQGSIPKRATCSIPFDFGDTVWVVKQEGASATLVQMEVLGFESRDDNRNADGLVPRIIFKGGFITDMTNVFKEMDDAKALQSKINGSGS